MRKKVKLYNIAEIKYFIIGIDNTDLSVSEVNSEVDTDFKSMAPIFIGDNEGETFSNSMYCESKKY